MPKCDFKLPCNVFKIFSQDILANYFFDKKSKLYFQINSEKLEKRTRYNMIHRKTFISGNTDLRLTVSAILESTMSYFGDISGSQSERIKTETNVKGTAMEIKELQINDASKV